MDYRADRMKTWIMNTFLDCLEETDFSMVTVGQIAERARINRSTFYRYFKDKYDLRDAVIDQVVEDYAAHMEVDFLHMDVQEKAHLKTLEDGLAKSFEQKRIYEILWNQKLLGRNVFEEMLEVGAKKVEQEILAQPSIAQEKKKCADWYARLLVNNYLVTVRWWFSHSDLVTAHEITMMMVRHMTYGTIPTLKKK